MIDRIVQCYREWFTDMSPPNYVLPDPELAAYDHGLGTLEVDGELKGYLAAVKLEMIFPGRQWWPWFVVVWADGHKERSFEDYGPKWYTVRELDAGYLEHTTRDGESDETYEFAWLPAEEAAVMWRQLGLTDSDF